MQKGQSGSAHVIIIAILTVVLVGALGVLLWQNVINKPAATVNSYAECVKSAGSMLQESYPEVCVTSDGKRFTNPEQKVAEVDKVTTKTYCAPLEKLCFDYPSDWTVKADDMTDKEGIAEHVVVSDEAGQAWLLLQTGMSGLGGACGNEDNSYTKILQTHTTAVTGNYLVSEATQDFMTDTAYAVSWVTYNGTSKQWTADMELNNTKIVQGIGKIDPCAMGVGVINGKNALWSSAATSPGALEFKYYTGADTDATYGTETAAAAVLNSASAKKAYAILQSAYYK